MLSWVESMSWNMSYYTSFENLFQMDSIYFFQFRNIKTQGKKFKGKGA